MEACLRITLLLFWLLGPEISAKPPELLREAPTTESHPSTTAGTKVEQACWKGYSFELMATSSTVV